MYKKASYKGKKSRDDRESSKSKSKSIQLPKKEAKRRGYKPKKAGALTRTTVPQATSQQILALQGAKKINKLPGETLLDVVNIRPSLSLPADLAHIVAQATVAAYHHTHSADLVFNLYTDERVDIWSASEHLHRR